ncbi:MAG: hypothetical protein OEM85_04610 [Gammaproteobacteria bacterium]|nr:hypothetical protein [Gammaproteobacteria bacterium]MDH3372639.1 hypothetical protein [Gammaproteobacteria bacterium]
MKNRQPYIFIFVCIVTLSIAPPGVLADTSDIAPPAADETLIYVIREGRLLGKANGYWIAVNDQTVARVRNNKYAVVRAKTGLITLNLANSGSVFAATTIDNRASETVYLKWRLGDPGFTELDEASANKMMRKMKRMEPIDAPEPNNEHMAVLMNLSRLGFDLMRPSAGEPAPDNEHAVITFFRGKEADKLEFGVWSENGFVGTLAASQATSIAVPAGTHFFMGANMGTTLLKAQVEAGKRYYVLYDYGKMIGRVRLTPVSREQSSDLQGWLSKVNHVEVNASAMSPRVRGREEVVSAVVRAAAAKAKSGQADFHLLGGDHAY